MTDSNANRINTNWNTILAIRSRAELAACGNSEAGGVTVTQALSVSSLTFGPCQPWLRIVTASFGLHK